MVFGSRYAAISTRRRLCASGMGLHSHDRGGSWPWRGRTGRAPTYHVIQKGGGYEPGAGYEAVRRRLSNKTWECESGGTYIGALDRVGVGELALDGVLLQSYDEGTECLA